jgi:hypothetical protein
MFESFKSAVLAHKNVVIAGVAVTALMGYIFPGSMMQQVEGNWWDDLVGSSNTNTATIDDRDDNTQANFAEVDQDQNGDYGIQFSEINQSNELSDDDVNTIEQFISSWRGFD